jgi:hypothetical protein
LSPAPWPAIFRVALYCAGCEAGMIKTTPQKIIAGGADGRFLNELKA